MKEQLQLNLWKPPTIVSEGTKKEEFSRPIFSSFKQVLKEIDLRKSIQIISKVQLVE